ncbi:unnamed protein product [Heterobilharzia americana]|nr:unnamed protein product [Heterobilharzia americana]
MEYYMSSKHMDIINFDKLTDVKVLSKFFYDIVVCRIDGLVDTVSHFMRISFIQHFTYTFAFVINYC